MGLTALNAKYAKTARPVIRFDEYAAGGTAIQISDTYGEIICMASVHIGPLPADHVAIKDYSENEGVLAWLIENKIVSKPIRHIGSGYVQIPICKLLVPGCASIR